MPGLQVLSAPTNQPTLNPRVQSAPSNVPQSLKVTPIAPQPRLSVVSQPAQQQSISVQPLPQQPQINVDNSPRFVRLGQAVKEKFPGVYDSFDDGALGKIVAEKYPGIYDRIIDSATPAEATQQPGRGGVAGLGIGVLKGAANTLNNLSGFGQKALQKVTGINAPTTSLNPELTTPTSTAQKVGFGAEQVGEFFIPGGAISKGAKAIEGVEAISKLPKVIQSITKLAGRAAVEGAEAAGVTAIQGGDQSDIKTAGLLGGSFAVIGKGIEKILQKVPETAWTSILKRTPTDAAKNPKLAKEATQTGLTGFTRQSIANKAQQAIQSIEVSLDDLLGKAKGTVSTAKVAGYLNDLRASYAAIPGEQSSVKVIDDIASQLLEKFKNGKAMSALEANQLKRDIYSVIAKSYGRGAFEIPAKTEAQKLIAAGLKREIEGVIPEVKSLNQKQAVYLQIKKALDKTIARTEGKGIAGTGVGLYDLLIAGLGTGAGALAGSPLLGVGLFAGKKTAESPIVLSATAKLLNYFNQLSPTKKLLFYEALKGLTVKSGTGISKSVSQPE